MTAPQDRLRAAAQKVLDAGAPATKGICPDWIYEAVRHIARNCDIGCLHEEHYNDPTEKMWDRYNDWAWIALLGPNNAPHLAAWLNDQADYIDTGYVCFPSDPTEEAALAFADNILGADK